MMNIPGSKLSYNAFGLKADRLLLPIDLARCPMEILPLANELAKPFDGKITLLYVFDRRRISAMDCEIRQAERMLRRVGQHLKATVEASFRVRAGVPHEEILAEASVTQADLILLPTFAPSFWKRIIGSNGSETARSVVTGSSTRLFVVDVRTPFNCLKHWLGESEPNKWAA
jgi:nucleotide-binding universal stress UspA family protein